MATTPVRLLHKEGTTATNKAQELTRARPNSFAPGRWRSGRRRRPIGETTRLVEERRPEASNKGRSGLRPGRRRQRRGVQQRGKRAAALRRNQDAQPRSGRGGDDQSGRTADQDTGDGGASQPTREN